jgi:tripartite-type tricarboxylate transporter receptor subunit TctC
MKPNSVRIFGAVVLGCLVSAPMPMPAQAQAPYPEKPIKLVVPFAPGGGADLTARIISQHLGEALGKPIVVENRAGGASNVGTEAVARAPADGYTLLVASLSTTVNASLFANLPYSMKDFEPVSVFVTVPLVAAVNHNVPVKSVAELIELAKSKPNQLNYASGGVGSANHVSGELFKYMAKLDITHVPYKGGGPAMNDLLAGHVQLYFGTVASMRDFVRNGRVRGLATTGAKRSSIMPELPTVAESGLPGFEVVAWYGVFAPAGTPRPIVERLSAGLAKILQISEVQAQLKASGAEAMGTTPAETARFVANEVEKWAQIVKSAALKPE